MARFVIYPSFAHMACQLRDFSDILAIAIQIQRSSGKLQRSPISLQHLNLYHPRVAEKINPTDCQYLSREQKPRAVSRLGPSAFSQWLPNNGEEGDLRTPVRFFVKAHASPAIVRYEYRHVTAVTCPIPNASKPERLKRFASLHQSVVCRGDSLGRTFFGRAKRSARQNIAGLFVNSYITSRLDRQIAG